MVRTLVAVVVLLVVASIGVVITRSRTGTVQAQDSWPLPFSIGDTVTLRYDFPVTCKVVAVRGDFVRCQSSEEQLWWWNLRTVNRIEAAVVR